MTGGIEGIPVIIRFKTLDQKGQDVNKSFRIEGIPLIIRFKTHEVDVNRFLLKSLVLKAFHL